MGAGVSTLLDVLRWWAAALVLLGHARHLALVELARVEHKPIWLKVFYFVTGFGHEAVIVFFVVSGFLVGGCTWQKWRESAAGMDQRAYWVARVSRIYAVLLPALVLGLLLDVVGARWLDAQHLYSNPEAFRIDSLDNGLLRHLDAKTFVGNLLMLQGIMVGNLGSNSPLWSLAFEWWYYVAFALAGCVVWLRGALRAAAVAVGAVLLVVLPIKLILWGLFWLLGLLTHRLMTSYRGRLPLWLGMLIFMGALVIARLTHNVDNLQNHEGLLPEFLRDGVVALACSALLLSAPQALAPRWHLFALAHRKLADFSYSVYLVHFPLMLFFTAIAQSMGLAAVQVQPGKVILLWLVLLSLGLLVLAYAFARTFETRTPVLRRWMLGRVRVKT